MRLVLKVFLVAFLGCFLCLGFGSDPGVFGDVAAVSFAILLAPVALFMLHITSRLM